MAVAPLMLLLILFEFNCTRVLICCSHQALEAQDDLTMCTICKEEGRHVTTDTGHNSHKQQAPFSNPTMYMFPNVAANLFGEIMKNVSCPTDFLTTVAKDLILKVCCATI